MYRRKIKLSCFWSFKPRLTTKHNSDLWGTKCGWKLRKFSMKLKFQSLSPPPSVLMESQMEFLSLRNISVLTAHAWSSAAAAKVSAKTGIKITSFQTTLGSWRLPLAHKRCFMFQYSCFFYILKQVRVYFCRLGEFCNSTFYYWGIRARE